MTDRRERQIWIDNVKVIACVLVVLGHFFQGLVTAEILPQDNLFNWFIKTIYCFHVPLFFICSGYLYQSYSKVNSFSAYGKNISKKLLDIGIPFLVFTTFKWATKSVMSSEPDALSISSLLNALFVETLSPYWFLLCLLIVFFLTPTFEKKITKIAFFALALSFSLCTAIFGYTEIYILNQFLKNYFWFVLGMLLCGFDLSKVFKSKAALPSAICALALFIICSVLIYTYCADSKLIWFLAGLLACASVICIIGALFKSNKQTRIFGFFSKYTMPIFLMHTIFAAPFRTVLLKLSVQSPAIHIVLGIIVSFAGPVIAAIIMEKTKYLEFLIYPRKTVKRIKEGKQ